MRNQADAKPGTRRTRMSRKTRKRSPASGTKIDQTQLEQMYAQMVRIREFEEAVKRTFIDHPGVIRGHAHLGDGAPRRDWERKASAWRSSRLTSATPSGTWYSPSGTSPLARVS